MIRRHFKGDRTAWRNWRRGHAPIVGRPERYLGLLEAHLKAYMGALTASKALSLWAQLKHGLKAIFLPEAAYKEFLERVDVQSKAGRLFVLTRTAFMSYRSRGKGRGSREHQYGHKAGRYVPHQGTNECQRRQCQMVRGVLPWPTREAT